MATINSVEDFLRAIREDDALRSEVRRELLTEEILTLPQRLAEFAAATEDRFDRLEDGFDRLTNDVRGLTNDVRELTSDVRELTNGVRELTGGVRRNTDHIGEIKGLFMERAAREDAAVIASDMGLRWRKTLGRADVSAVADDAQCSGLAAGVSRDNMKTFRRADLVFEATDDDGQTNHVAVEISYTADGRDTVRAIRHAEYLTLFTGTPAYAAILSVHIDDRIEDILTEDNPKPLDVDQETSVFWSRLPEPEPPS